MLLYTDESINLQQCLEEIRAYPNQGVLHCLFEVTLDEPLHVEEAGNLWIGVQQAANGTRILWEQKNSVTDTQIARVQWSDKNYSFAVSVLISLSSTADTQ